MADFDLTQTDAQVQSILNDAQNAQGAGAQTTLTTEYIMLKDTSGSYHKILKDSFTEACRNVLAGLLVNNDKGTTIDEIPAIASGDFGSVTPANLASVLGGVVEGKGISPNTTITFNLPENRIFALWYGYLGGKCLIALAAAQNGILEIFNNFTQSLPISVSYANSILTLTHTGSTGTYYLYFRIL